MRESHVISIVSLPNGRELGGYTTVEGNTVKSGRLLRSGALDKLSEEDKRALEQLYKPRCVVDFRDKSEVARAADILPKGAKYTWAPVIGDSIDNPAAKAAVGMSLPTDERPVSGVLSPARFAVLLKEMGGPQGIRSFMINTYRTIAESAESAEAYKVFFTAALETGEKEGALLFHCTAGKDRTGIAAVLLLTALGIDKETILKDYLYTNQQLRQGGSIGYEIPPEIQTELAPLLGVDAAYLAAYYETVEKNYGSIDRYLDEVIGLKADNRALLRSSYTST